MPSAARGPAMPIRFVCPVCWAVRDGVDDALVGKMIKCMDCHAMSVAQHSPAPNASSAMKAAVPAQPAGTSAGPMRSHEPVVPFPTQPAVAQASSRVLFSSGDIPYEYDVVDLVFAHGNSTEGAMKGMQPVQAFQVLVNWLGQTAVQIGANAVIHIRLDFRVIAGQGLLGGRQAFEVYGYGTAVKISA
jgi:hypothetical protein